MACSGTSDGDQAADKTPNAGNSEEVSNNNDTGQPAEPEPESKPDCAVETGEHLPVPQQPSRRFNGSCASCHGAEGEGHEEFVGSIVDIDFEIFESYARAGLSYGMPSFDEDEYPSAILEYDWAWLNGVGAQLSDDCSDSHMTISPSTSTEAAESLVERGLESWLMVTDEGMSCASCHGPEPIDLVTQGYTVGDLLRRALLHVDEEAAWDITYGVLASRYLADVPDQDPESHAVFQPGGRVIEGTSLPDASEAERRDHAFGLALLTEAPALSDGPITGPDQAEEALTEIMAIDLSDFEVGIPMARWTVDAIRGGEFRGFAEWIPEVAHVSTTERDAQSVMTAYTSNPTDPQLQDMLTWNAEDTVLLAREYFSIEPGTLAADIYRAKYASVLLAHHFMKTSPMDAPEDIQIPGTPAHSRIYEPTESGLALNPWWQLSAEASRATIELNGCESHQVCAGFTPDIQVDDVPAGGSLQSQVAALQLPWGWLGFLYDNALESSAPHGPQPSPEDYTNQLSMDGYTNHAILLMLRRNLELTRGGAGWLRAYGETAEPTLASSRADWRGLSSLLSPSDSGALDTLRVDILSNGLRAFLWALRTEVETSGEVHGRSSAADGERLDSDYSVGLEVFEHAHGDDWYPTLTPPADWTSTATEDAALYQHLRLALGTACDVTIETCS